MRLLVSRALTAVRRGPGIVEQELEVAVSCPRADQLSKNRENLPAFQSFLASKQAQRSQVRNVRQSYWRYLRQAFEDSEDYIDGQAGFGLPDDMELLRLRGGFMLGELVKNMWNAVNNATATKYFAYSAHDTIQRALMLSLGVKEAIVGSANPYYASVLAFELWESIGQYYVKILFSPNSETDLIDYSTFLPMKSSVGLCPLADFVMYSQRYIPQGVDDCYKY